jgi:hypothetical protein
MYSALELRAFFEVSVLTVRRQAEAMLNGLIMCLAQDPTGASAIIYIFQALNAAAAR